MLFLKKKRRQGECRTFAFSVVPPTSLTYILIIKHGNANATKSGQFIKWHNTQFLFFKYMFIIGYKQLTLMFIITNKEFTTLGNQIFEFMSGLYPNLAEVDIEVIHTDLTEDNVFGWTTENNDQNEIEIHNDLSDEDYIITLIHELIHVDQNVRGLRDDEQRENEAYKLEKRLADNFEKYRNALMVERMRQLYPERNWEGVTLVKCY